MLFTFKVALWAFRAYEVSKTNGAQTELFCVQTPIKQLITLIKRPDLCEIRSVTQSLKFAQSLHVCGVNMSLILDFLWILHRI